MSVALPAEAEIRRAVMALRATPGEFQVLAERFLAIREGGVYRKLTPKGRNSDGTPIKGYPDAFGYLPDDRLVVIETTVGDWRKHIREEDIPGIKAIGVGKVRSFHFFCLTPSEGPVLQVNATAAKRGDPEAAIRRDLRVECGVEEIEIMFVDRLCAELRSPDYLPLLLGLGVKISVAPFTDVRDIPAAGPPEIAPTVDEFEADQVVPRSAYGSLLDHLVTSRQALVEGRGASGKTTVALALGRAWGQRGTAYYLDLQEVELREPGRMHELHAALTTLGSPANLIILDNCHQGHLQHVVELVSAVRAANGAAIACFQRLRTTEQAGLEAHFPGSARFEREATREDLALIYQRLGARRALRPPSPPPAEALDLWEPLRGDLIAFCLALAPRLARLIEGADWAISTRHALDYIRDSYLAPLEPAERAALRAISALGTLEMPASQQSLGQHPPKAAIRAGLILQSRHSSSKSRVRLRLAHHAMGGLILEAAGTGPLDAVDDAFVQRDVFQSCYLARRLWELGQAAEARRVLSLVRTEIVCFPPDVPPGYYAAITQLFEDTGVATAAELERDMVANIDQFPSAEVPIVGLSGLFGFSRGRMPALYAAAVERLKNPAVMATITAGYVDAPATAIMSMVNLSESHGLPFTDALLAPLRRPAVLQVIGVNLLQQSCGEIDEYLASSAAHDPKGHAELLTLLRRSPHLRARALAFIREPIGQLQQGLSNVSAATLLLEPVSVADWRARGWDAEPGFPDRLRFTLQRLASLGRDDLADETVRQAVARRDAAMWTPGRRAGKRFTALLGRAHAVEPTAFAALAEHLKARGWLDPIYNRLWATDLAEILAQLWQHLPPDAFKLFETDTLIGLLEKRVRPTAVNDLRGARSAVQAAGLLKVLSRRLPAGVAPAAFAPPAGTEPDALIYWIGYATLAPSPPKPAPQPPWTAADLKTWPTWVAPELGMVERWARS